TLSEGRGPPSNITDHNPNRIIISLTLSGAVAFTGMRGESPMADDHVRVFDTTLRDGEQAPGFSLRPAEKLQLARQIDALGVDIIEAGFPIASPADAQTGNHRTTNLRGNLAD